MGRERKVVNSKQADSYVEIVGNILGRIIKLSRHMGEYRLGRPMGTKRAPYISSQSQSL